MPPPKSPSHFHNLLEKVQELRLEIASLDREKESVKGSDAANRFVAEAGKLIEELGILREEASPIRFGSIGITLGRSDSIAKFFAFSFSNQERENLGSLPTTPFYGSGVYAIYYSGNQEPAYQEISCTETPIYVGKANPRNPQAESVEEQGQALWKRLREHAKNIEKTELDLADFHFRAAPIQTGMQAAVEDFMIRLFKPVWNKETKICYGIGKHGDSAKTRANKRSPWDTMHPGRRWAKETSEDQMRRSDIEKRIRAHFMKHPPIPTKEELYKLLSLT